ncbi:uncharacterized mitochondrial protein AtMg00810-like [Lycium ferocissimum]|uniref:uncharacterized mitochondrial protein AtMg00810-like n=1 Tax=Lycium ferocissimum TaxID=112874 RepID=UPI0028161C76|nr:uncharacterized mitochondrial protein AtMg00810-like [Lycium ferocissimum]
MNVVGSRWVCKTKLKSDGSIDRYKARLVDKGQLDVKNAFLHGYLQEEVYVAQPPGFIDSEYPNHVCSLMKALYGLKQAPRSWFDRFSLYLLHLGFKCSRADSSLFVLHCTKGTILLLMYVDDIVIIGSSPSHVQEIITALGKEFAMKDLGPLHFFLGIEVTYFDGGIHLNQSKYATELLKKTDMIMARAVNTPLAQKHGLHEAQGSPANTSVYRSIVGSLQYLTLTKPNITHAVNLASQFMQTPNSEHFQAVKRIFRYMKETVQLGLRLIAKSPLRLYGFSDADWGGCTTTRRSTTGYSVYLGANCISWASKKHHTVARSSAEAEYRALASAAAEITWIT